MEGTDQFGHDLNPAQRRAVYHTEGPLLVIAGAGTGKTKTITYRIGNLIRTGTPPTSILAVTFTNKAAYEMRERVLHLLRSDPDFSRPVSDNSVPLMTTFHSLGVLLLRENAKEAGLPKRFSIADRDRSKQLIKESCRRVGLDPKEQDPAKTLGFISHQKNDLITVEEFADSGHRASDVIAPIWRMYEELLEHEGAVDFDDLLIRPLDLLKKNEGLRARYQDRWKYIHVDEYQDTNLAQYHLSRLLAGTRENICVVGDADQTIYTWRGARIHTILNFENDYTNAHVVTLEENYRSTQTILGAANDVISVNARRKEKKLFTRNAEGERLECLERYSEKEEARTIVERIKGLLENKVPASEIAILYRTNFQSRALEEAFLSADVPYMILGTKFLERKEVRDVLAFIEAALNPDSWSNLRRIINLPPRGIGKTTLLKLIEGRRGDLTGKTKDNVDAFYRLLSDMRKEAETGRVSDLVHYVIKHSGLEAHFKKNNEEERVENIRELASLARSFDDHNDGVEAFLEHTALVSDQDTLDDTRDEVRLMTVHAAKGLEFDHVFISGLEEGLFPHEFSTDDGSRDEEEERRLFYVALTRARKKATLTYANTRTIFGATHVQTPSRFISDIDEGFVEKEKPSLLDRPPLYKIDF